MRPDDSQNPNQYIYQIEHPIECSYRNDSPIHGAPFHSHAHYEVYYFQEGECTYLIGDKLMVLQPGDLILMHGMTLHCANPSPDKPYVRSILHFNPAYVHKLLRSEPAAGLLGPFEELRNARLSLDPEQRAEVERLYAQMAKLAEKRKREGGAGSAAALDKLDVLFLELLLLIRGWFESPAGEGEQRPQQEEHVQGVLSYLEEHYAEELTLDAIADALHLTKPYLSNLFKRVTGTTVFKYLYNRRINQAKILFRFEPHRSVSSVSKAVGFSHLAHFSRLFKTTVGMSPQQYRGRINDSSREVPGAAREPVRINAEPVPLPHRYDK
ncbi:AraC family transcriptional regulator [Cohnella fermenti]|uniref:Helix-turn-helix domain-containing protein n=1 Tax=Cohnella fermenti TaxID=2565925 RepID=A0A4S4BGC6_9BACL|nr:helix-turn-helix domain-containing protein [Cohnella fermenti]THF73461.1 helix-turn-helix domain-containing protein [Cohnella fermenti]